MKVVIQRVSQACVVTDGKVAGKINKGLLILLGIHQEDTQKDIDYLVRKISNLRIFEDEQNKMNWSIKEVQGEILSVSQFTLYAETKKGNRPSFAQAAFPDIAQPLYHQFNEALKKEEIAVETGKFGADMQVSLVNDGPVTIVIDTKE